MGGRGGKGEDGKKEVLKVMTLMGKGYRVTIITLYSTWLALGPEEPFYKPTQEFTTQWWVLYNI